MSEPALQRMSVAEYLRTEPVSQVKREYVDGFVYPLHGQAGASKAHVRICANITAALNADALRAGCRLYSSDMKLRPNGGNTFFYPDVMVSCGPDNGEEMFETDACLLVEVLSPGTAANDRLGKFGAYTALPGLETYLMVEQAERCVHAYRRQGQEWVLEEVRKVGRIDMSCLGRALSLEDIYAGVLP